MNTNSSKGLEVPPPPIIVNSLQALKKLRPTKRGHEYSVFAYVLNRDMVLENGELDDLHAVTFQLGSFEDKKDAFAHAKEIICKTGHTTVVVSRYGDPVPLSVKHDEKVLEQVRVENGKLVELENNEFKREHEAYEKRIALEREIAIEAEEETDKNSVEYLKRQWYLAVHNELILNKLKKEVSQYENSFNKRMENIKDHIIRHPEHEDEWFPLLEKRLTDRGETALLEQIREGYARLNQNIKK